MRREAVKIPFTPILHEDELFTPKFLYTLDRACTCGEALYVRRVRTASITSEKRRIGISSGWRPPPANWMRFPLADATLEKYAITLAMSAISIYTRLSRQDKKSAKGEKHRLTKELIALRTPRALVAAGFLTMPFFFRLYQALKRNIPHWLYRSTHKQARQKAFLACTEKARCRTASARARILLIGSPEHGNLATTQLRKRSSNSFTTITRGGADRYFDAVLPRLSQENRETRAGNGQESRFPAADGSEMCGIIMRRSCWISSSGFPPNAS